MAKNFNELETIEQIREGELLAQVNHSLSQLQRRMAAYSQKHGDRAKKAVGKLKVELDLVIIDDGQVAIIDKVKMELPAAPTNITFAMQDETATDEPCLFIRKSGSGKDSPKQKIMCTSDGRAVDPETGEVIGG